MTRSFVITLTLLLAFVLNALMPFYASYASPVVRDEVSSVLGEKILICTDEGIRYISPEDYGKRKTPFPRQAMQCGLCYLAAAGLQHLAPIASAEVILLSSSMVNVHYPDAVGSVFFSSLLAHRYGRAPPVFV